MPSQAAEPTDPEQRQSGRQQHSQQARNMHRKTAKPRADQMMVFLLVSPLHQHQTHPRRKSYKNIAHKIRRQGGGGGTEGVVDNINPTDRRPHHCHPPPPRNWARSLFVGLVSWLACLLVLIIIPCGFLLVNILGFQPWSWKTLKLFFHKLKIAFL